MSEYGIIGVFTILGTIFVGGGIVTSKLIAYRSPKNDNKNEPYECGETVIGEARIQFRVGYYLIALLFLIFDIESLFLFPGMKIFRTVAEGGDLSNIIVLSVELAVFVFILTFGLIYAWRKGILKWD